MLAFPLVDKSKCLLIALTEEQMARELVSQPSGFKTTNIKDDEKRGTYVVTSQMCEFQNDLRLKVVGL